MRDTDMELFRTAMRDAGLQPPEVIESDGKLHRFSNNGNPHDTAGWYVFYGDGIPAGSFGDWRSGLSESWRAKIDRSLSADKVAALRTRMEAARHLRDKECARQRADAATRARTRWDSAHDAPSDHPYLIHKKIQPHGAREHDGALVLPVIADGDLCSLQFIPADGPKRFLSGGRMKGGYFGLGDFETPGAVIYVAEGFATSATVHEATGAPVAVAFSADNLASVATSLRTAYPDAALVICADDDVNTAGNPGLTKAREAAQAVNGFLAVPDFGGNRPDGATDFNDLHRYAGLAAVREVVERAVPVTSGPLHDAWPRPKPIIAELKSVPIFDADTLLPPVLRAWIMDEVERMPCPPDFIAATALVALGSVVGARCAIKPKARDSWLIVPNLWGGIVGDPSAKKSPAWSAALKPLDRLIALALEDHQATLADYETEKVVFDAQRDAIEGRIKVAAKQQGKGDPAEIARELRVHGEHAPKTPTLRRYKTNDTTVEKLGELLRENPAGLLVLRDELVGLIATWEREGRVGERAFFLESWNGNQGFDTDRIGRGHISIPNLCVSIFGGIQPDKLTMYLEQASHALANDGMLQRFQLLVYPDPRRWEWRDRSPNKAARDAAVTVFDTLADFDPVALGAAPIDDLSKFPSFCFDAEAQDVFIEWSEDLHRERMVNEEEPLVQQHLAKSAQRP